MPKFSTRSKNRLGTIHRDLHILFGEYVIKYFDCTVLYGLRSPEEQFELYKKGRKEVDDKWLVEDSRKIVTYKDGYLKKSKHNYIPSLAVDVAPYYVEKPHIRWDDTDTLYYFAGLVMGIATLLKELKIIESDIIFGGNWDNDQDLHDQTFMDLVHFQIA